MQTLDVINAECTLQQQWQPPHPLPPPGRNIELLFRVTILLLKRTLRLQYSMFALC